jgi:hypothetical protein
MLMPTNDETILNKIKTKNNKIKKENIKSKA